MPKFNVYQQQMPSSYSHADGGVTYAANIVPVGEVRAVDEIAALAQARELPVFTRKPWERRTLAHYPIVEKDK